MPWHYTFDPQTDTLFVSASGVLTDADLLAGIAEAMRDPNFHPDVRLFDDFSQVDGFQLSDAFVSALHHPHESKRLRGRHAVLLAAADAPNSAGEGLRGLKSARSREFTTREAALAWLNEGVPAEKIISAARADALLPVPVRSC